MCREETFPALWAGTGQDKADTHLMFARAGAQQLEMQSAESSDEELMRRIGEEDPAAFEILVDRHLDRIHGLAFRMLGRQMDAEDVVQDIFAKLWTSPGSWQAGRGSFPNWLSRVTSNACIDRLRRRRPGADLDDIIEMTEDESAASPFESAFDMQRASRVAKALNRLPERQKLAVILFHYQGHSGAEVAETMNLKVAAVESLLSRARRKLKADLEQDLETLLYEN